MTTTNRVKTGIAELDEMLSGGFLERDAVIVAGAEGTGKTTLGLQYVVNGATRYGENGIYVTFEELPDQIYRDAKSFGWDLRSLEDQDKLRVVCTSPKLVLASHEGVHLLDSFIQEVHARRIVIDSLSHVAMFLSTEAFRQEAYRLIMYLKTKRLSSLLLAESSQSAGFTGPIAEGGAGFLADAIVLLKPVEIDSAMRNALAILKQRGSDYDKRLREYTITASHGITIAGQFKGYDSIMSGSARKTITDEILGSWTRSMGESKGASKPRVRSRP